MTALFSRFLAVLPASALALQACAGGADAPAQSTPAPPGGRLARPQVHVEFPADAAAAFSLRSGASSLKARLLGARPSARGERGGSFVYPAALPCAPGVDAALSLRAVAGGVEDLISFPGEPPLREVAYEVELGGDLAAIRQVGDVVELLDGGGVPRFHMEPPYITGAGGEVVGASARVEGCEVDRSSAPPWGRPAAGRAGACVIRVSWGPGVSYPAVLDPVWTQAGTPIVARSEHAAAPLPGGRVLVAGGVNKNGESQQGAEVYDRASNTWAASGKMLDDRQEFSAVALDDGRVLVTGGVSSTIALPVKLDTTELYAPGPGQWVAGPAMSSGRSSHASVLLKDGRVLIAGGTSAACDVYDPAQGAMAPAGALKSARENLSLVRLQDGRVLALGGKVGTAPSALAEIFDPSAGAWTQVASMNKARDAAAAALLPDGRVLVTGGRNADATVKLTTEIFDPATAKWSFGPNMAAQRERHQALALLSGKVLVTGGGVNFNDPNKLASVDLFDPATEAFQALEPMTSGRAAHTMTLLPTGEALVVGHYIQSNPGVAAELFGLVAGSGQCGVAGECLSGFCVDGVCCDAACEGSCQACTAAKKGGGKDGQCGPVAAGSDPDGDCPDDGAPSCQRNGLCDGAGACQLYPGAGCAGQPCSSGDGCSSGFCVDGVCCDGACAGPCRACSASKKGQGGDGVCEPVAAGNDPDDECAQDPAFPFSCKGDGLCDGAGKCRDFAPEGTVCNTSSQCVSGVEIVPRCNAAHQCDPNVRPCEPFVCDKGGKACADSCSDDTRCAPSAHCDVAAGACVPDEEPGSPCASGAQCLSGFCVDGVCCDAACEGPCQACTAAKKGGGKDGQCGPVAAGSDPDGDCPDDGAPSCGRDGTCNGAGDCRLYPLKTLCGGFSQCAGVSSVTSAICDGQGHCSLDPEVVSCDKYACFQGKCLSSCAKEDDCSPGFACVKGSCGALLDPGKSCSGGGQCKSGFCVDGVCCDSPCTGQCEACDVSESVGKCSAIKGAPHGERLPCGALDEECAGACDGANRQLCSYPGDTTLCEATSCQSAVLVKVVCNGKGACVLGSSSGCAPYGCDKAGCKAQCATDDDCSAGAVCDVDKKQCAFVGASCVDPFTLRLSSGKEQSCAPYSCSGGVCKATCAGAAECAEGYVCAGQSCQKGAGGGAGAGGSGAGPAPAEAADDGCGCRAAGSGRPGGSWLALALGALVAGRRRRR